MNIAKLNLSHGTHTKHARYVETIRSLAEGAGTPVAILMDLLGHKYRTGNFAGGSVVLEKDAYVTFTSRQTEGDEATIPVNFPDLQKHLKEDVVQARALLQQ